MNGKEPTKPCAICGNLMWHSRTCLPEGQAVCQPCRRQANPKWRPAQKNPSVTEWDCQACGKRCERKPTKGQRPKWCEDCRRSGGARTPRLIQCQACGENVLTTWGTKFCSTACSVEARRKPVATKAPTEPVDLRGELRRGYEDGDADLFFAALVTMADTSGDCWSWQRQTKDQYPIVKFARRTISVHRMVLEMKHGAPLGSQAAHHICANTYCVNPDHLQPVTHRENAAEMLARQSYLSRIRELEAALAILEPDHPLLDLIKVA